MSKTITGIFKSPTVAAATLNHLETCGISEKQMSVVASDSVDREQFAVETNSKLPEGTAVGATTGAAVGAIAAGLTAVGAVATGGAGVLAAGPIVAAFTGAGVGATAGGTVGAAIGAMIPEHEIKHYEDAIDEGKVIIGVTSDDSDQQDRIKEIFEQHDAEKISRA